MTEAQVQNDLYHWLRQSNNWPILPNTDNVTGYEADMLVVTKAGYVHEYEIKLTQSDFKADKKKWAKHCTLAGNCVEIEHPYNSYSKRPNIWVTPECAANGNKQWYHNQCHPDRRPKRFWYVVHGFEPEMADVPEYAGLIDYKPDNVSWYRSFRIVKKAPDLPAQKVDDKHVLRAIKNMLYRYWELRLNRN